MVTANLSVELLGSWVLVMVVHPGWVKTRLGGENAELTAQQSVSSMLKLFTEASDRHNGKLYDFNGELIPW